MLHILRLLPVVMCLFAIVACGKDSSTPAPIPTPTPPAPVVPTPTWSFAGRVVDTVTGTPIGGAVVEADGLPHVTAGGDGVFVVQRTTAPNGTFHSVAVRAPGFLERVTYLQWQTTASAGADLGLIRDAAPFSLGFYRQLVRNAYAEPANLQILRRWNVPPRFYIRTIDEDVGRDVESEVLAFVADWLHQSVAAWAGWSVPQIDTGREARGDVAGWIRVVFTRTTDNVCGRSFIGRNPGVITFSLDACDCGSRKVGPGVIAHEVGHALGFWHVEDPSAIMFPIIGEGCRPTEMSPLERHHAAIAFQRPFGNADIDRDPAIFTGMSLPDVEVTD